jgi:hypothetical protein
MVIIMPWRNAALVEDISAIVKQIHGGPARYVHDPVEVVHIPLGSVPDGIPHRESGP